MPYDGSYWQPHSQLLVWLYSTGIFGTGFMLYFLIKLCPKNHNKEFKYRCIIIMCFIELTLCVTEGYFDNAICFVPYLMLYYCSNISVDCEKKEKLNE